MGAQRVPPENIVFNKNHASRACTAAGVIACIWQAVGYVCPHTRTAYCLESLARYIATTSLRELELYYKDTERTGAGTVLTHYALATNSSLGPRPACACTVTLLA